MPFDWRPLACNYPAGVTDRWQLAGGNLMWTISVPGGSENMQQQLLKSSAELDLIELIFKAQSEAKPILFLGEFDASLSLNLARIVGNEYYAKVEVARPLLQLHSPEIRYWKQKPITYARLHAWIREKFPARDAKTQNLQCAIWWSDCALVAEKPLSGDKLD